MAVIIIQYLYPCNNRSIILMLICIFQHQFMFQIHFLLSTSTIRPLQLLKPVVITQIRSIFFCRLHEFIYRQHANYHPSFLVFNIMHLHSPGKRFHYNKFALQATLFIFVMCNFFLFLTTNTFSSYLHVMPS